jgi:hypothetical protein
MDRQRARRDRRCPPCARPVQPTLRSRRCSGSQNRTAHRSGPQEESIPKARQLSPEAGEFQYVISYGRSPPWRATGFRRGGRWERMNRRWDEPAQEARPIACEPMRPPRPVLSVFGVGTGVARRVDEHAGASRNVKGGRSTASNRQRRRRIGAPPRTPKPLPRLF